MRKCSLVFVFVAFCSGLNGLVLDGESIIPSADILARGIEAGEKALEVTSENIANQHTTKDVDGNSYKARKVILESTLVERETGENAQAVQVSEIVKVERPGMKEYNPDHPHADEDGYVEHSNVQVSQEMVAMMKYNRWVEAQYAVANASVKMVQHAIAFNQY